MTQIPDFTVVDKDEFLKSIKKSELSNHIININIRINELTELVELLFIQLRQSSPDIGLAPIEPHTSSTTSVDADEVSAQIKRIRELSRARDNVEAVRQRLSLQLDS
jgi:hypothetical protein